MTMATLREAAQEIMDFCDEMLSGGNCPLCSPCEVGTGVPYADNPTGNGLKHDDGCLCDQLQKSLEASRLPHPSSAMGQAIERMRSRRTKDGVSQASEYIELRTLLDKMGVKYDVRSDADGIFTVSVTQAHFKFRDGVLLGVMPDESGPFEPVKKGRTDNG